MFSSETLSHGVLFIRMVEAEKGGASEKMEGKIGERKGHGLRLAKRTGQEYRFLLGFTKIPWLILFLGPSSLRFISHQVFFFFFFKYICYEVPEQGTNPSASEAKDLAIKGNYLGSCEPLSSFPFSIFSSRDLSVSSLLFSPGSQQFPLWGSCL